jgi:hypothetical protein
MTVMLFSNLSTVGNVYIMQQRFLLRNYNLGYAALDLVGAFLQPPACGHGMLRVKAG